MKYRTLTIWGLLCIMAAQCAARDVLSFNAGWQFKKGPFSGEPKKVAALWDGKWENVNLPHTWNAKDMQEKAASFYQGVGYYKKRIKYSTRLSKVNVSSCVLKE